MYSEKYILKELIKIVKKYDPIYNEKEEPESWITVKGNHIPIYKGQTKDVAVEKFIESKEQTKETKKELTETEEKEVGIALYTINKEAKKIRDIRQNLKDFLFESQTLDDNTISFLQNKFPKINFDDEGAFVEDNFGSVYRDVDAIDEQIDENQREINYQETKLDDEDEADDAQDEIDAQQEHINELEKLKENLNEVNLHEVLKKVSSEEKEALYELKQKVIKKLNPKVIGIHKFDDDTARKLYQIGDFTFHGEDISDELTQEEYDKLENLGQISKENKLLEEQKIDVDKAKEILSRHLENNIKNSLDFIL